MQKTPSFASSFGSAKEGVCQKQWRDVVSVRRISGDVMDDAYLDSWASRLDIEGLLHAAREALGPELRSR